MAELTVIICPICGKKNHVNVDNRPTEKKYCTSCRTVILEPRKQRSLFRRIIKRMDKWALRGKTNTHKATIRRDGSTV